MVKVTLLGTGAPLAPERAAMGIHLEAPGCEPLLLDTCGGFEVFRQLERFGLDPSRLRDVVLSHRHGDHIGGMMPLFIASRELHCYGPGDALDATRKLLQLTYPHLVDGPGRQLHYHPLDAGQPYAIAGFEITFFEVVHRVPTYALRVAHGGTVLAYSADSLPCEALVACARNADLFLCDALCEAGEHSDGAHQLMHPTAREAAEMAAAADARALALVHLARYADPKAMLEQAREVFSGPVTIPDDGEVLEI